MHKYFIEVYKYTELGYTEAHPFFTATADNELQLRKIHDEYAYQTQEGSTMKAYKVVAHKLAYVKIANVEAEINGIFTE